MYATQVNYLLRRGTQAGSVASVSVARPSPEEREAKGQLLVLLEVPGSSARLQVAVDEFLRSVEAAYYAEQAADPEASLEQALRVANAGLPSLCSHDRRWPERTSMAVFAYRGDQVYFATAGSVWGALMTPTRVSTVTENGSRAANVNPLKPFSSIASGPLQPDSTVCFATLTLLDYIAQEKLRKVCSDHPPLAAVQQLDDLLSHASPALNIAAIVVRRIPVGAEQPATRPATAAAAPASQRSMHQLADRRQATAQLLSEPSLRQSLGSRLSGGVAAARRTFGLLAEPETWANLRRAASRRAAVAGAATATLRGKLSSAASYRWPPSAWITGLALACSRPVRWVRSLRSTQQIIVALLAVAVATLAAGTQWQLGQIALRVPALGPEATTGIAASLDSATNALIYGDEPAAAAALEDVARRLAAIDPRQANDPSLAPLRERQAELQRRLSRSVPLPSLGTVAAFPDQQPSGLALADGYLWTVTGSGLVRVGLDGSAEVASNGVPTGAALGGGEVAYAVAGDQVTEADADAARTFTWQRVPEQAGAVAVASYAGRLYSLAGDGGVYRYRRTGDTFGQGAAWLKNAPASAGTAIAVDGAVYVLTPTGVVRYSQGNYSPLGSSAAYPALADVRAMAVGSRALYLLEPSQRRIVVLNKQTGRVEQQFTSDELAAATAVAVADDERTAYVVAGAAVRSVDLTAR